MPTRRGAARASAPTHYPDALRSLAELEAWHDAWTAAGRPTIEPVVPFRPRTRRDGPLLVCDDTLIVDDPELPWKRAWTFERKSRLGASLPSCMLGCAPFPPANVAQISISRTATSSSPIGASLCRRMRR